MKQIVVSIKNDEYKIDYKESKKTSTTLDILKKATKGYSKDRLVFEKDEKYKIFTVRYKGKKNKVIVAKSEKVLEENIGKIVSEIQTNTALFVNLNKPRYVDWWDSDVRIYDEVIESHGEFFSDTRFVVLCIINFVIRMTAIFLGPIYPTIAAVSLIKLIVDFFGGVIALAINEDILDNRKFRVFCAGILGLIDGVAYSITKKISNFIADLRNNNFFKRHKSKKKKVKELSAEEKAISDLFEELEKDKIHVEPVRIAPQPVCELDIPQEESKLNIGIAIISLLEDIKNFITLLSPDQRYKFEQELSKIEQIKLEDIASNEVNSKIIYSNLLNLKENIIRNIQFTNVDTVDTELEGVEKPTQYKMAR